MEVEGAPILLLFVLVGFQASAGGGCHWEEVRGTELFQPPSLATSLSLD